MGKLNQKASIGKNILSRPDVTLNEEGGIAFRPDAKMELALRTVSSLVSENGFYKPGNDLDADLRNAIHSIAQTDPAFILKLALYARSQMYLRTVPVVLMGEYAMSAGKGKVPNARKYITATIQRADEITELIAYVMAQNKTRNVFKGKIPQIVKHAIADAFGKFDAYQLAKYNRPGGVTLRDALSLSHAKATPDNSGALDALVKGTLAPAETWEVLISTQGSTKENWEKILPRMGYMALLRNLRNLLDKGVDMTPVLKRIADPKKVAKSKQFPYRFVSAYKELEGRPDSGNVLAALSDAVELSVQNVPDFSGRTFVTCDISGSMDHSVSEKSKIKLNEIGCLFGAIMHKKSPDAVVSVFATDHVPVSLNPRDSLFTNMNKMLRQDTHGCGTDAYKVMNWLIGNKVFVDRIVLFSDMQCYCAADKNQYRFNSDTNIYAGLIKYRQTVNPNVFVYSFDLANYSTIQIPQDDARVCLAGGFSDKILNFIPMFERSRADMLAEIESISI
ncbi:MAG: TROVE domain-containing protein [Alphaproteobacteria bacterium]|nr:TROVE domain-containing protein [Alphaproteobacteria bacterium]